MNRSSLTDTQTIIMQLVFAVAAISAFVLGRMANAAPAIENRIPRLGEFQVSITPGCPLQSPERFEFGLGSESDACRTFWNNTTYAAINVEYWHPQCLLTLFNTYGCTDPGIVSGLGCWTPEGGIKAYKVACPYKTW
ncbi:hypothetical protein QBC46DRAFT_390535 [Diplogelasinospora grovesii]|uniref:Uncharacterized protein n=1 Tax=Diplogelasinospora grovesii TaxID=303347 RepID=A0AAN6N4Y1_9PEZI|nr:hypothetical protein QBC46DRAFT_390535 [Diplogelasinospora grovesii]